MTRVSLKTARLIKGLTQDGLAQEVGVTKATVGSWESGKTYPGTDKVAQICKALDRTYDEIEWCV